MSTTAGEAPASPGGIVSPSIVGSGVGFWLMGRAVTSGGGRRVPLRSEADIAEAAQARYHGEKIFQNQIATTKESTNNSNCVETHTNAANTLVQTS
jgi:hypothetical protein